MNQDTHIILDKELRRDIDGIIQKLKLNSGVIAPPGTDIHVRKSRERSLCLTKLQEAAMWLGMDLKAINDENPQPAEDVAGSLAKMVADYVDGGQKLGTDWRNGLKEVIALRLGRLTGNPYPNSKDPSNTKIDAMADGLKL